MSNPPESLIDEPSIREMARLASLTPAGCFVEVGVYKGGSAWFLARVAREQRRALHLFDTFSGIPHARADDNHRVGDFGDASLEAVQRAIPGAVFHVGVFPNTMPADLEPVAFVHCDCDQHDSVKAVIDAFWPRLVSGGVIVFDDTNQRAAGAMIRATFGDDLRESMGRSYVRKGA